MKSQIFLNFTHTWLPIIALIIFFSIFCISVIYVSRKKTKNLYNKLELIALDDGERNE